MSRRTALVTASVLLAAIPAAGQPAAPAATLVMPFHDPDADPQYYWLAEGSALLLGELLARYGATTVPRLERVAAFEALQLPPAPALSHATMIKIGQFVGASDVVIGTFGRSDGQLTVRARIIQLHAGRLTAEVVERGPLSDLFAVYDRVARALRAAPAPAPPARAGTLLASPRAFELYVKGLVADVPTTQRLYLEQAAVAAPADDRIKLSLWRVYTEAGDHGRALAAVGAVPASSLEAREARYLSAVTHIDLTRYDEAFTTLTALQREGHDAAVLNALGVVQLRRGPSAQGGRATYYFSQAAQSDGGGADHFFNLGYAYWVAKDPPAAVYWLREAVRRNPADGDAHFVLGAALQQSGHAGEAARERELAGRLSETYESLIAGGPVPRGLERLEPQLRRARSRVDALITSTGQRDQAAVAAFHLEAGRRAYAREADGEAERELRRALYLSPYLADAHLVLGRVHLRNGRVADAIVSFKIALWSDPRLEGYLALAEAYLQAQNPEAAKAEVERALALDPASADARALRERVDAAIKGASEAGAC